MNVALAQYSVVRGQSHENLGKIESFAIDAAAAGASLLQLPEMCTTGFSWSRSSIVGVCRIAPRAGCWIAKQYNLAICGSFLSDKNGNAANTFTFYQCLGCGKRHIARCICLRFWRGSAVEAGTEIVTAATEIGTIGCSICYDLRFPELFRKCALAGRASSCCWQPSHTRVWRTGKHSFARGRSKISATIAVNQCGHEDHGDGVGGVQYFGHSMVVDPWGRCWLRPGRGAVLWELTRVRRPRRAPAGAA